VYGSGPRTIEVGFDPWGPINSQADHLFFHRVAKAFVDSDWTHNYHHQALDKKHTVPGVHNPVQVSFAKQPVPSLNTEPYTLGLQARSPRTPQILESIHALGDILTVSKRGQFVSNGRLWAQP
jgi:hypothetical protein